MQIWRPSATEIFLPLTVDSTIITVDSTLYTADMTVYPTGYKHMFRATPRFISQTPELFLKNENTNIKEEVESGLFQYIGNELFIYFNYDFKEGQSFEITVMSEGVIMRREKGYATDFDDLENYKFNEPVESPSGRKITIMK